MTNNVLLIRNAFSYDFGGGERVPVVIGTELIKHGYHPIIVSRSAKVLEYAAQKGLPVVRGWWWSRQDWSGKSLLLLPAYIFWQILLICWYLRLIIKTSAQFVHPMSKDDFIAATIAAKLLGKKVLWSDYADLKYVYLNHGTWYKNPVGKLVKFLDRFASSILVTSYSDKKLIQESLGTILPSKYTVVHYGVTSEPISPTPRSKADKDAIIFAATSRLVTDKGIGELVQAFNQISQERTDLRLWLFGEGPEESMFKQQADGNTNIVFSGFPSDTLTRVASADVFVHPSYLEGFSISLVEATKMGLPIIACDVGGNPELVVNEHNGLLIPPRNSQAIAAAMTKLADNKQLRVTFGKQARVDYEYELVFESIVSNKIVPMYEK